MARDYSPFTPGVPVPVEFFVGRREEVNRLRANVAAASAGRLQVVFVCGERGIGKSSLASFVRSLVERDAKVLGLHTFLGGVTTLEEMVRRVFDRLLKESLEKTWHKKIREFFGNHIREVGLFGITMEFGASNRDLRRMVHDFAPALRNLYKRLAEEKSAVFLVLDDINGLAASGEFANWLKSLVDEIATATEPLPLCLVLVGLEQRRQSLISLQPSLARVFDLIEIKAWSREETQTFFQTSFSKIGTTIDQKALDAIVRNVGGLPVLAHEIGDAVFKVDDDNHIDLHDATHGIIDAAEIVGRKHLEPQVFQAIRSERYRAILGKLAGLGDGFRRGEVRARLNREEQRVFDNFLKRMRDLGVIVREPEKGQGVYRFSNLLHRTYFWLEAQRAQKKGGA